MPALVLTEGDKKIIQTMSGDLEGLTKKQKAETELFLTKIIGNPSKYNKLLSKHLETEFNEQDKSTGRRLKTESGKDHKTTIETLRYLTHKISDLSEISEIVARAGQNLSKFNAGEQVAEEDESAPHLLDQKKHFYRDNFFIPLQN